MQTFQQLPLWIWIAVLASVLTVTGLVVFRRRLRRMPIHWPWLILLILVALLVFAGSLLVFPKDWGASVGWVLALTVVVLRDVIGALADLRTLITTDPPHSSTGANSGQTTSVTDGQAQINQGQSERNIQTAGDYIEHQHIHPPAATLPPVPQGYIPPRTEEVYIPRGDIEQKVRDRLKQKSTVAIVGVSAPGGLGKTELAKGAANDLKDRFEATPWIDVGEKTREQVLADLLAQCNLSLPPTFDYGQRVQAFKQFGQQHALLIVLDDVRQNSSSSLADFLPPSPPCAVLITSRIQQLSAAIPPSATLKLDRMTREQALAFLDSVLTPAWLQAEPEAVELLLARCRFNPLALSIATRRIQLLENVQHPIALFAGVLQKRLTELQVGNDPRLNLFTVFDLSYHSLSADDQRRFRHLAAFAPTGFSPTAAAHVWGDGSEESSQAVARLLNLSLLKVVAGESERYRLHDLLDEYAADKLRQAGEAEDAARAHAEFLIALFDEHYTDDPSTAPHVAPELDNLRAAANWAMAKGDGAMLGLIATRPRNWLYNIFRINTEWEDWLTQTLKLGIADRQLQANVLKAIGDVQQFRDDRDAALQSYEQALGLFRQVGDKLGEANVLKAIGDVQQFRKETNAALQSYEQALGLFRQVGDKLGEANVLKAIGDVQQFRKETNAALQSYEQALGLFRQVGDKLGEANVLKAIGDVQQFRKETNAALQSYEQALGLFRQVGDKLGEANVLKAIGDVQQFRDDRDAALQSYEQALGLFRQVGDKLGEANVLKAIGDVQQFRDDRDAALQSYEQALGLFRQVGDKLGEANVLKAIGDVQQFRDDRDAALQSYEQALGLFRQVGDKLGEANVLKAIGDVQQFRKETNAALQSYEQALGLFRQVGDKLGEANVLKAIGDVQQFRDDRDAALQSYEQALGLFRQVGDKLGEANVLKAIGDVQQFRDDRDAALQSYEQALGLFRQVGDKLGEANVLKAIGDVQQFRDDRDAALQSYEQALGLFRQVGDKLGEANVRMSLGDFYLAQDQWTEAISHYENALPVYRAIGAKLGQANTLIDLGKAYFEIGEREKGMGCVKEAGDLFAQIGSGYWAVKAYRRLTEMLRQSGRVQEAEQIEDQLKRIEGS